jgi:hypothetical protein
VPARQGHVLAFDTVRARTVMFGGLGASNYLADTWTFDGINWTPTATPTTAPPIRRHAMAHDAVRGRTVLFGGLDARARETSDTWEFDGTNWTQRSVATFPVARAHHALAFDTARGRTVLFGGVSYLGFPLADTWEYDGSNWAQVVTASSPTNRYGHAMAYDSARGRVVAFGGGGGITFFTLFADTWEYDGSNWTQVQATDAPVARMWHAVAYDSSRARTVLFGGGDASIDHGDTWEYDGSNWKQVTTVAAPSARRLYALAYDSARGRTVLFGGVVGYPYLYLGDTWEYDGKWTRISTPFAPSARGWQAAAYDSGRDRVVVFGGTNTSLPPYYFDETWELLPSATPTWTWHGLGCAGSAGTPDLDRGANTLPALGSSFPLVFTGLPANAGVLYLAFGFGIAHWHGAALPLDLAPAGMPGCKLWIEPVSGVFVPHTGNGAFVLTIPNNPALAGVLLATQALVLDPAATNGFGAVTNAGVLRLN